MRSNNIICSSPKFWQWLGQQVFGRSDDFELKCGVLHVWLTSETSFFAYKYPSFLLFLHAKTNLHIPPLFFWDIVDVNVSLLTFHRKVNIDLVSSCGVDINDQSGLSHINLYFRLVWIWDCSYQFPHSLAPSCCVLIYFGVRKREMPNLLLVLLHLLVLI